MAQLDRVLPVIGAVADVADQNILVTAAERFSVLRRFSRDYRAFENYPNLRRLRRAVFFHRQGEIRHRSSENQSFRASGLSLITDAIVHWNTVYLDRAVRHLHIQGTTVPDDLLAHVAPLGWEHIGLTGDYLWTASNPDAAFRRLRDVRATFQPLA